MPRLNAITAADIEDLNQDQLTELLRQFLLWEVIKHKIPLSASTVSYVTQAPDGGIDGEVKWDNGVASTDWLPCRNNGFQCKATDMGPADCKAEILTSKKDAIVPQVEATLAAGGSYILFFGRTCTPQGCLLRLKEFYAAINGLNKDYCATADIRIYPAEKIAIWCNQHAACITYVQACVGGSLPLGLKTWGQWKSHSDNVSAYVPNETLEAYMAQIQKAALEPGTAFRIQGLSGLGKTRLVFEAFRPQPNDLQKTASSSQLVYLDAAVQAHEIPAFLSDLHNRKIEGIVVVDNCNIDIHKRLAAEVERADSRLKLITIDFASDVEPMNAEIPTLQLAPNQLGDVVKVMLDKSYPELSEQDRAKIANYAAGFPRIADLLARARRRGDPNMGAINDEVLLRRLLWGYETPNPEALKVIEACAVFTNVGIEGEAAVEYRFLAQEVCGMSSADFFGHLHPFKERGIIQQFADYIRVTPKPLAIQLAATWWKKYPPDQVAELLTKLPRKMGAALCDQLAFLDFSPKAREIAKSLCGEQGPFGRAEVLLSKEGSRLFRLIVEVNPPAALGALQRVLGALDYESLLQISGAERRNLITAIEKLCFWEDTFEGAASTLLTLATAENETWQNNASGLFKRLFHLYLSGTKADLKARIHLAQHELANGDLSRQSLVVQALGHALESNSFWRMGGVESQDSRLPQTDFVPERDAIREYWNFVTDVLADLGATDGPLGQLARNAFTSHIRGVIHKGGLEFVKKVILKVATSGIFWPAAALALDESLRYEGPKFSDAQRQEINELMAVLAPRNLSEKLRTTVSEPDWITEEDGPNKYIDVSANRAKALAEEIEAGQESLLPYLPHLSVGEQRQGFIFGQHLAEIGVKSDDFIAAALHALREAPPEKRNAIVLAGFLRALPDRELASQALEQAAADPLLNGTLVDLTRFSRPSVPDIRRVLNLVPGQISVQLLRAFAFGSVLDHWPAEDVVGLAKTLENRFGLEGASIGFHIAYMYCLHNEERTIKCLDYFRHVVTLPHILDEVNKASMGIGHPWETTTQRLLKGTNDAEMAKTISAEIMRMCGDQNLHYNSDFFLKPVLELLFKEYQEIVWAEVGRALLSNDWMTTHHLVDLIGDSSDKTVGATLVSSLPMELLTRWCRGNGPVAAKQLARITTVFEKHDDRLTWHPVARMLIEDWGDQQGVLDGITTNIGTYGWEGSAIPYYQAQTVLMREFENDAKQTVRKWAKAHIEWFEARIARDQKQETHESIGVYD